MRRKAKKSAKPKASAGQAETFSQGRRPTDLDYVDVSLGDEIAVGLAAGPSDSSERAHLLEMLLALPQLSLIAADAGFVGYEYLTRHSSERRSLLIRVGSNVRLLKKLGYFKESGNTVYLLARSRGVEESCRRWFCGWS